MLTIGRICCELGVAVVMLLPGLWLLFDERYVAFSVWISVIMVLVAILASRGARRGTRRDQTTGTSQ